MMCKIEPLNVSVGRVFVLIEGCSSLTFFLYHGDSLSSGPTDVCKLHETAPARLIKYLPCPSAVILKLNKHSVRANAFDTFGNCHLRTQFGQRNAGREDGQAQAKAKATSELIC